MLNASRDRLSTACACCSGPLAPIAVTRRELLASTKAQVAQDLQRMGETVEAVEEFARVSEDVSSRLHHEVLASRMRPLAGAAWVNFE